MVHYMFRLDENRDPVPVDMYDHDQMMAWGKWFEDAEGRRVGLDDIGGLTISTVCIGFNIHLDDPPLIFETLIMTDDGVSVYGRWPTWADAEIAHQKAVSSANEEIHKG